ncbi:hypothetical protein [Vibrio agarivorans]|uniref:Uncharacterized protein n=1 Tax=Vibrio agarivorans TaxID=153622 RepID=A0ABT7Y775_9VIBR|nr:hypothetical protein [Vibrio agarivorans]MDN2483855.1 hypothetical protein [Vibrio agarivorans]
MTQLLSSKQERLLDLLASSPLAPGTLNSSEGFIGRRFNAIFVNDEPVYLVGESSDYQSGVEAIELAESNSFKALLAAVGYKGETYAREVSGDEIQWPASLSVLVESECGNVELGSESGAVVGIVLSKNKGLATMMCVTTEVVSILVNDAPDLVKPSVQLHEADKAVTH